MVHRVFAKDIFWSSGDKWNSSALASSDEEKSGGLWVL